MNLQYNGDENSTIELITDKKVGPLKRGGIGNVYSEWGDLSKSVLFGGNEYSGAWTTLSGNIPDSHAYFYIAGVYSGFQVVRDDILVNDAVCVENL